jgi:hypothetical protein
MDSTQGVAQDKLMDAENTLAFPHRHRMAIALVDLA